MSTFSGFLDGIEYVSIDRFTEFNWKSKIFFLSHCHMDHMIGLNNITPELQLPGPLYLSEVSSIIIRRRYPAIKNLVSLKLGGKHNNCHSIRDAHTFSVICRFGFQLIYFNRNYSSHHWCRQIEWITWRFCHKNKDISNSNSGWPLSGINHASVRKWRQTNFVYGWFSVMKRFDYCTSCTNHAVTWNE